MLWWVLACRGSHIRRFCRRPNFWRGLQLVIFHSRKARNAMHQMCLQALRQFTGDWNVFSSYSMHITLRRHNSNSSSKFVRYNRRSWPCRFRFVLPAISAPGSIMWCIHIIIAVWLTFNVGWNYFRTVFTPPGAPPDDCVRAVLHTKSLASDVGMKISFHTSFCDSLRHCVRAIVCFRDTSVDCGFSLWVQKKKNKTRWCTCAKLQYAWLWHGCVRDFSYFDTQIMARKKCKSKELGFVYRIARVTFIFFVNCACSG